MTMGRWIQFMIAVSSVFHVQPYPTENGGRFGRNQASDGDIRLVGGNTSLEGRLEVFHNNKWGTVCDDEWKAENARVACRQLGFSGGHFRKESPFGMGTGRTWMDGVNCDGDEARLTDCSFNEWGEEDCTHFEDVGVICEPYGVTTPTGLEGEIRLVGGNTSLEGRLEVFHNSEWGTVCDDEWKAENARVACRQLGHSGGHFRKESPFGMGTGRTWMDGVDCDGDEARLTDCSFNEWGEEDCTHYEDVGVICEPFGVTTPAGLEGEIRLVGGSTSLEGRLEVFHNNKWGTVCDDEWKAENARVACRQLGFSGGHFRKESPFGMGTGRTWMDGVNCDGDEARLTDCSFNEWGEEDCTHYEDVGVICEPYGMTTPTRPEGEIRLVGGNTSLEGRLEVFHNSEWGTVCDDEWKAENARVACRQLGYSGGHFRKESPFGMGTGRTWMDGVDCDGDEARLTDCSFNEWGEEDCTHYEDVGVICEPYGMTTPTGLEGEIRLVGGSTSLEGRLEVFHNSEWGTVCDDEWKAENARVACRQLGHSGGHFRKESPFGMGTGRTWMDGVNCDGDETRLTDCSFNEWGEEDCTHYEDVGVICESYGETTPTGLEGDQDTRPCDYLDAMNCLDPLMGLGMIFSQPDGIRQACSKMYQAFTCMDNLPPSCMNNPEFAPFSAQRHLMDQMCQQYIES